jgi:catechol 2,3-dioxygenase-like lactoylglutathione lyase family enzyme
MSRFLGEIRQLGYVVPDIEQTMEYWANVMGVGPWFYAPVVPVEGYHFEGETYEPRTSVALANAGFIQVELIQARNDVPSMYRDFLAAGHTGLHHVAYWTGQFDHDLSVMEGRGFRVKMGGRVGTDGRFVYFDKELHPGTAIELSEVSGPKGRMFRAIREASVDWDGSDPVRQFPLMAEI